jgi:GntR family transcriptional regulator, transcriptional repressor for pyruvate dehydrogenase complex
VRSGKLGVGTKLPTEAEIMAEFGVSRTVVREALSKLQASGVVQTRHGIGTFVRALPESPGFRISPEQFATLNDVIAVLELRIGVETEAAGLDAMTHAVERGDDAVQADFAFHTEIARATQNKHFFELMETLGAMIIPRARLNDAGPRERQAYLRRVNAEHESILDAIAARDADAARAAMRTHLTNSRERRRRAQRMSSS